MSPPTLILSPRHTDDSQALWRAAIARQWDVHRLASWRIDEAAAAARDPFLYAEALFGPTLAEQLGVTLVDPPEDWLCRLPEQYCRRSIELSTLGEARCRSTRAFIKPPNDKSFPAAVYTPDQLPSAFDADMAVLIAEPVAFESEFRCFVLDRAVRALSLYSRLGEVIPNGPSSETERAALMEFVSGLLRDDAIDFPHACVVDCGPIEGRGWAVVELNAAWGAGIYGCNPDDVLDVVRAATIAGEDDAAKLGSRP